VIRHIRISLMNANALRADRSMIRITKDRRIMLQRKGVRAGVYRSGIVRLTMMANMLVTRLSMMDHLGLLVNDRVTEKGMEMDLGRERDMDQMVMDPAVMALRQMERVLTDLPILLGMNTRLIKHTDITHPMDFPMALNHIHLRRLERLVVHQLERLVAQVNMAPKAVAPKVMAPEVMALTELNRFRLQSTTTNLTRMQTKTANAALAMRDMSCWIGSMGR
jgi:hypothetical protein